MSKEQLQTIENTTSIEVLAHPMDEEDIAYFKDQSYISLDVRKEEPDLFIYKIH